MTEIVVELLTVEGWREYRDVRLAALQESPQSFTASYDEEAAEGEDYWRERMERSDRFVAKHDGTSVGVVSLGRNDEDQTIGEIFGLYVTPEARHTGTAWRLVQAAADRARSDGLSRIFYWVGTENARAIAFAANFGFRPTGQRRTTRVSNEEFGDQEVAMVMSLLADPGSVPNPTRGQATSHEGPLG